MQYTDLTKKELQREYNRMARRYTGFVREPLQLDMAEEDPLLGKSESLRAARHFGTVLKKDPGPHHPGGCWFGTAGPRSQRVCH